MKASQVFAYTEKETSIILCISEGTLQKSRVAPYHHIKNGKCPPFIKEDGSVFYRWDDVMDFIESRTIIGLPKIAHTKTPLKSNRVMSTPATPFIDPFNF